MLDRIIEQPWAFYGGCLVWFPITIWVLSLVQWMITGDVDVLVAIPGIAIGIVLGVLTLNPPDPRLAPVFFFAVLATVLFFPFVRQALIKRALHKVDVEQVERAYDQLSLKPGNVGYEMKIARLLYDKGLPGHAIAVAERVLQHAPKQLFESEHRMLNQWRAASQRINLNQPLSCVECGFRTPQGQLFCERCGAPFLLHYLKGKLVGGRLARKLIGAWAATVAAIVGLPSAATALPPSMSIPVMIVVVAVVVAVLWIAFRPEGRAA